jgi:hypothetical protein
MDVSIETLSAAEGSVKLGVSVVEDVYLQVVRWRFVLITMTSTYALPDAHRTCGQVGLPACR